MSATPKGMGNRTEASDIAAIQASTTAKTGSVVLAYITAGFEDFYATGGREQGARITCAPAGGRPAGPRGALPRRHTLAPSHPKGNALKTRDRALAVVPLAHTRELWVTRPVQSIRSGALAALVGAKTRPILTDVLHGQGATYLLTRGQR
ncbi:hypothetical protein [Streptomyces griseorubiginosus]|uniref:hypothetical protein n=1 Tax=Streptomyces griseorubiginosus TaxID=67304 RepID=UPI0036E2EBCE